MRLAVAVALVALWFADARADREINAVIGDASRAGRTEPVDEVTRIRDHLAFVHGLLARREVSQLTPAQREARVASLADLARYIERGVFPRRTRDGYDGRRPRFIDDRGVHCAVGQLIADSGHEDLARSINARFEYAHVREMTSPALVAWASARGFTVDELAMIQPSYHGVPTPDSVRRMIIDAKDAIALRCGQEHAPMSSLLVIVENTERGATNVGTKSTEPFAKCFVREASKLDRGGHAYDGGPEEFTFGIDLKLPSPQAQLERRIATWTPSCTPRPGAISREATIDVASTTKALAIEVTTSPRNALVERCLKEQATSQFRDFAAGAWKLHAVKKIALPPHVRLVPENVKFYAREVATACNPTPAPRARSTISITAKPDDPAFTITATGSPDFSICVSDALNAKLREQYRVAYMDGEKRLELFRIDAPVKVSVTIDLESQASRTQRLELERERMEREMHEPHL